VTYFEFLAIFLGGPLVVMGYFTWRDAKVGRRLPVEWGGNLPWLVVAAHVLVAVVYTTPWDNYLVASQVWGYPPERVVGVVLGWVPIEEYTFFVLQSLLAGLWLLWLARRLPLDGRFVSNPVLLRAGATGALAAVWILSAALFVRDDDSFTYMGLILLWALPPIMIQTLMGADILWRNRRVVGSAILSIVVYLSAADALAIGDGIWRIDPKQSLNIFLAGVLPIEEFVFFMATSTLLVFGITLVLSVFSYERVQAWRTRLAPG